jgi:hypothetical protein
MTDRCSAQSKTFRLEGPNAGLTEVLIPAGYVTTVFDPVFSLNI